MQRSLLTQLTLPLVMVFVIAAIILILLFQHANRSYSDKIQQALHQQLAIHMVHDNPGLEEGKIEKRVLENAFHTLMLLGPAFEIYALDLAGNVLVYSAEPGKVKDKQVDLDPINHFLRSEQYPIYGEDPRNPGVKKIFSAAPILGENNQPLGYLYVILGGEKQDLISDQQSFYLSLNKFVVALLLTMGVTLVMLIFVFARITRPVRSLNKRMHDFVTSDFQNPTDPSLTTSAAHELQTLEHSFTSLAQKVSAQITQIKSTDQLRRELLTHISHDLKTPLSCLRGYLETWLIQYEEGCGRDYIETSLKNAQQLHQLVEQLLELAQLEGNTVTLYKEPIAVAELAQDVLTKFALEANKRGVTLELTPKDPGLQVTADIAKLERVITNLIDNAIRHSGQGDQVYINLIQQKNQLVVQVGDTGCGIAQDEVDKIFDAHYRASNKVNGQTVNTGLGLAIVKKLLELHESNISVSSELEKGTVFSFALPNKT